MKTAKDCNGLVAAVYECAMQMMANAAYIQDHLDEVEPPDGMRPRIQLMCRSLIETKHDVMHEMFELAETADKLLDSISLAERVERIMRWLAESCLAVHQLVTELLAASERDARYCMACLLVTESATNIFNTFRHAQDQAKALGIASTSKRAKRSRDRGVSDPMAEGSSNNGCP